MFAIQTQERQRGFLLDEGLRGAAGRVSDERVSRKHARRDEQPVDVLGQGFGHFLAADVCDGVQREAIADFVVVVEVLSYRVDYEPQEVRVLVHEQGDCEVALHARERCRVRRCVTDYLLLAVLVAGDEVDGLHMADVDLVAEDIGVYELGDVSGGAGVSGDRECMHDARALLFLVAVEVTV